MERTRTKNRFNLTFDEFCHFLNEIACLEIDDRIYTFNFTENEINRTYGSHEIGVGLALRLFNEIQNGGGSDEVV